MSGGSVRLWIAPLVAALLYVTSTLQVPTAHAHGCAPSVPPPVSGSPASAPATPGIVLINEVLSIPKSTWYCSSTYTLAYAPWVELYNPHNQPLDLHAAHASLDTGPNTRAYYLPLGAAIAAQGFLVIFPAIFTNTLVAGTTLRLVIAGVAIDQITIAALGADESYARVPNGSNSWQITSSPTIAASNTSSQATPTPTPSSSSSSTDSSSSTGSRKHGSSYGTTNEHNRTTIVSGVQPDWNKLQLPTPVPASNTSSDTPSLTTSSSAVPPASSGMDLPHLLLIGLLAVALALVLFWCWRLFAHS